MINFAKGKTFKLNFRDKLDRSPGKCDLAQGSGLRPQVPWSICVHGRPTEFFEIEGGQGFVEIVGKV